MQKYTLCYFGDLIVAYCCHCTDCQAQSNSAFGIFVWLPTSQFTIARGRSVQYVFNLDNVDEKLCAFYSDSVVRIYYVETDDSDVLKYQRSFVRFDTSHRS